MANVQFRIYLKSREYGCLYLCNHFYEAYANNSMFQKCTCVEGGREGLLYCDYCFKEKIVKYTKFKYWSKEFFDNVKKNLIQYFVKIDDYDRMVKLGDSCQHTIFRY